MLLFSGIQSPVSPSVCALRTVASSRLFRRTCLRSHRSDICPRASPCLFLWLHLAVPGLFRQSSLPSVPVQRERRPIRRSPVHHLPLTIRSQCVQSWRKRRWQPREAGRHIPHQSGSHARSVPEYFRQNRWFSARSVPRCPVGISLLLVCRWCAPFL